MWISQNLMRRNASGPEGQRNASDEASEQPAVCGDVPGAPMERSAVCWILTRVTNWRGRNL